jgi:nucleoside-diphosphate-sugar epimerase
MVATQRLLEACRAFPISKIVYASSSSVYGNAAKLPTAEDDPKAPLSPYGITKLAAEQLCSVYEANWGLKTVCLRYFSVYGPRQRPDMAAHRVIRSAISNTPFAIFGDGTQLRDFTYVLDAVNANLSAATLDIPSGSIYNIGGGSSHSLIELVALVEQFTGRKVEVLRQHRAAGDAEQTRADISRAANELKWRPLTDFDQGIAQQIDWQASVQIGT